MRSQFSRAALAAAGIAVCTVIIYSWDASWQTAAVASQPSSDVDPQQAIVDAAKRGDTLFQQRKWAEARAAYDQVLKLTAEEPAQETPSAKARAIECSVILHEFDDALRRATPFRHATDRFEESYSWPTENNGVKEGPVAQVAILEKYRQSLKQGESDPPVRDDPQLSKKLAAARVAADLDLMKILDPDVIPERTDWGWATRSPTCNGGWTPSKAAVAHRRRRTRMKRGGIARACRWPPMESRSL